MTYMAGYWEAGKWTSSAISTMPPQKRSYCRLGFLINLLKVYSTWLTYLPATTTVSEAMSAFDEPLGVISTAYLKAQSRQSRHDRQLSSKAVIYYPRVLGRL
jgi:hypothetical protein